MLRVNLQSAKEGMALALPVRHPKAANQILLKIGYEVETAAIKRLHEMGVRSIWVRYPSLECLEKYVNAEVVQAQSEVISEIADTFNQVQSKSMARMNYDAYTRSIGKMITSLIQNPQAAIFLNDMGGDGADMVRHASTVAYISLLIGLKLEGYLIKQRKHVDSSRAKEVNSLGVGAMLHDVGILHLSAQARELWNETGDDSDPAFREHPSLGYQIVRGHVEPTVATVLLNHHQRVDGSGYAGSEVPVLDRERIHIFARIVALADYFDETQNPVVGDAKPAVTVLRHLLDKEVAKRFDEQVIRALFTVVPAFAPGTTLRLSDGRYAVAIDHNINHPCQPVVQIIDPPGSQTVDDGVSGEIIDLTESDQPLIIIECDGRDISEDLFDLPDNMRTDMLAAQW